MSKITPIAEKIETRKERLSSLMRELGWSQGKTAAFLSRASGDVISPQSVRRWMAVRPGNLPAAEHFSRDCPGWPVLLLQIALGPTRKMPEEVRTALEYVRDRRFNGTTLDLEGTLLDG